MTKNIYLPVRITQMHEARIEQLRRQTGLTTSAVIRLLIENAEMIQPTINVGCMANKNAGVLKANGVFVQH